MKKTLPNIGDYVTESDLEGIFDLHIILKDAKVIDNQIEGVVAFLGEKLNSESDQLNELGLSIADIYHSSIDSEDGVTYDEAAYQSHLTGVRDNA